MSGQHTPGRLRHKGLFDIVRDDKGEALRAQCVKSHDARRLAACWNAFEGVETCNIENLLNEGIGGFKAFSVMKYEQIEVLSKERDAARTRTAALEAAIDKLAACKGRFHTEQNFVALLAVRGAGGGA